VKVAYGYVGYHAADYGGEMPSYYYGLTLAFKAYGIPTILNSYDEQTEYSGIYPIHFSEVESLRSIPRLYIVDVGFASVFGVKDLGYRVENIVAIELLRRKYYREPRLSVSYWMDSKGEVDFVVSLGFRVKELIQVSYDIDDPQDQTKRS